NGSYLGKPVHRSPFTVHRSPFTPYSVYSVAFNLPTSVSIILPSRHQPPLPIDRIIRREAPTAEALEMHVAIVGAGPAGLACAIALAQRVKQAQSAGESVPDVSIAVLEKAGALGEHSLSGAVVNPCVFREL